ncbi:response regulator transcription factor [Streptomyces echinatus]|uniref:Two-component system response regulator DesR n=1 Tax=Streptomyces echinatus TaxID=67293 RepID=A0A7W9UV74_9ACTN|nr:response regulator transcription factor [Streptomyces echinatus]MBB5932475.1 two-component system response regulator DesR [Streptomyces echinatus]
MGIDVLVSDDLHLSRFALAALLERREEVRVVGPAESNFAALQFAETHRPDVAIIGFEGEDSDAITIAEKIAHLGCRSMLLATAVTRSVVRQAFDAGIAGIVERSVSPRQFVEAIHRVHQGERVFDAELTVAALSNSDCPLSAREFSVLEHVARGDTVREIAGRMHLSQGTVRNYLASMVTKMGARNRIDALRIARDARWI